MLFMADDEHRFLLTDQDLHEAGVRTFDDQETITRKLKAYCQARGIILPDHLVKRIIPTVRPPKP